MLVVKVELWPGGDENQAVEIGRAAIANLNPSFDVADYLVVGLDQRGLRVERVVRRHRSDHGVWALLSRAFAPGSRGRLPARWQDAGKLLKTTAGIRHVDPGGEAGM